MTYQGARAIRRAPTTVRAFAPQRSAVERTFAFGCFTLLLAANVSMLSKTGGLPDRSLLTAGLLILCGALFPADALLALRKNTLLLFLAAGLAIQGFLLSLVNGAPAGEALQAVIEIHVQTAVVVLVAVILAQVCGARACAIAIVAVIGVSAAVAVLQMMNVHIGWSLRQALGPLANDELKPNVADWRPTGLSYSPIQLATQVCLAFGAYAAVRERYRRFETGRIAADPAIVVALLVFFTACLASGTRAPILGGVVFLVLYALARRGSWLLLLMTLGGIVAFLMWPLVMDAIQSSAPRVARVDDESAATRIVFAYYGVRLFLDNPIGYGLTFDPTALWGRYWSDLYLIRGAQGAQVHPLHNYVLSMLNIYGFGLLLFVPFAMKLLKGARGSLIFFVPYLVEILFHNAGPFFNDVILWFAIAAVSAAPVAAPATINRFRQARFTRPVRMNRRLKPRFSRWAAGSRFAPR